MAQQFVGENVVVLKQSPGEGKQRALEKSLPYVTGEIIYLTDIDCRPEDQMIANLLRPLLKGESEVVTGASQRLDSQTTVGLVKSVWATEQVTWPRRIERTGGILGRHAAVRRLLLEDNRAFSVPALSGADYTLAKELIAAGHTIVFVPGYPTPSEYPADMKAYIQKQSRWLRNVPTLRKKYKEFSEVKSVNRNLFLPFLPVFGIVGGITRIKFSYTITLNVFLYMLTNRVVLQKALLGKVSLRGSLVHIFYDQ